MRRVLVVTVAAPILFIANLAPAVARPPAPSRGCQWVGSRVPISERVAELMARMTTADKLDLVHGQVFGLLGQTGPVYVGQTVPIPALCVPALTLEDGPAGVGDGLAGVTQLPAPVALAATWSPQLAASYGGVIGAEDRGKGVDVDLGPTANIVRDPRWGRAFETYGEDPYLQSALTVGYVDGVQGQGVMAQVKHLAAYADETLRDSAGSNSIVSERALQEIYLPPFQAAAQARVASVMCSYNEVNGVPACQNGYLLTQVLDEEFGFPGFVTSDWFATHTAAPSADAGLDLQMPDGCFYTTGLEGGLASGAVSMTTLNQMVARILGQMFRFGLFDRRPVGSVGRPVTTPAHTAVATSVAEQSIVLLKNARQVLPLQHVSSIAVVGADGGPAAYTAGGGSAHVTAQSIITPLAAIAARAGRHVRVTYDDGSNVPSAISAARTSSVAIVFADLAESEGQDLPTIELPAKENALIAAVAASNPNTIVVLNTGSAVTMPWLPSVAGVLEAWYPGQEDGAALAAVLFGDTDPSGKLPVTFPASEAQMPTVLPTSWPGVGASMYSEGIWVGYRYYQRAAETPLFPFGFGLSYTTFRFHSGRVSGLDAAGDVRVSVAVTNTGRRTGADVAQLYVGDPAGAGEPPFQLEGFRRVTLAPGQTKRVTFTLTARQLSFWDNRWVALPGTYTIAVGDSSSSLPVSLRISLAREVVSGSPVGAVPSIHPDPPGLAASCPKDTLAPDVAAGLTIIETSAGLSG